MKASLGLGSSSFLCLSDDSFKIREYEKTWGRSEPSIRFPIWESLRHPSPNLQTDLLWGWWWRWGWLRGTDMTCSLFTKYPSAQANDRDLPGEMQGLGSQPLILSYQQHPGLPNPTQVTLPPPDTYTHTHYLRLSVSPPPHPHPSPPSLN